jgi:nucleoside-diphosphate-sugar epimerase
MTKPNGSPRFTGKTLVTGAAGHLGANLVHRLLADGREVRVLLRTDSNNDGVEQLPVEKIYGDLRDEPAVKKAVDGVETVFHAAAMVSTLQGDQAHKREIYGCNVIGTRTLLGAARQAGVARVVVTGSFSATGYDPDNPSEPSEESRPFFPFTDHMPYARTKVLVEHETLKACIEGLDAVIAVSTAILGPHDYKPSRMGRTLIDHAHGKLRAYIPGGFEFVAARDIVEGHLLAMERGRMGNKYIFATQFLTIDDIMQIFEEVTGRRRPRLRLPAGAMKAIAGAADLVLSGLFPSMPRRFTTDAVRVLRLQRHANTQKARTELGFQPTSIRDAVREAYDHFALRGLVPPIERSQPRSETRDARPEAHPT